MNRSPIKRQPLNEQVADRIRGEILSGAIRPGSRLVQVDWATSLGVSRMPVRDAFLQLQSEGLLTSGGDGTAVVASTSGEDLRDMYQIAALASGIAARRACSRMSDESIEALQAAHDNFIDAVEHDDSDTAFGSNNMFHRLVNIHSESPRLVAVLRNLSAGMPSLGVREIPEWRKQAIASHGELIDAIRSRDAAKAAEIMELHVLSAADRVIAYLSDSGYWDEDTPESSK